MRYASSKSPGKGNKGVKGKGTFRDIDAGGRSKGFRGPESHGRAGARKATRSTDGKTGGNSARGGKDNPFHTAKGLANSA